MRRIQKWMLLILFAGLLVGCSNNSDKVSTTPDNTKTDKSGKTQVSTPTTADDISNVPVKLINKKYSDANKSSLKNAMNHFGLNKIYIPYQDVVAANMIVAGWDGASLVITYSGLRITESQQPLDFGNAKMLTAHLKSTDTGKWVTVLDDKNNEKSFLIFEKDGMYIKLEDFRGLTKHQVDAIADAFKPFS